MNGSGDVTGQLVLFVVVPAGVIVAIAAAATWSIRRRRAARRDATVTRPNTDE